MPSIAGEGESANQPLTKLPFPPVTRSHILNCSYHSWHPQYRSISPKARLIPLSQPFIDFLRADGIVLPPESNHNSAIIDASDDYNSPDDEEEDPSAQWQEIHAEIRATIAELGGNVTPKLNWSSPKDATWIAATNNMECRSPNDVYLLLKSSDFITHDLEHAFDDCEDDRPKVDEQDRNGNIDETNRSEDQSSNNTTVSKQQEIPYYLILRKYFQVNPSVEFRCFVRKRKLLCVCQRDLNHYSFLNSMQSDLLAKIQSFFTKNLQSNFPDPNFTFDVYIPSPHKKVWLIDINPWAQRTDPLLFSWLEILQMKDEPEYDISKMRLPLVSGEGGVTGEAEDETSDSEDDVEEVFVPEFRLVGIDDPEAYSFSTPQYSAHKLPREVVDASQSEGGLREFMGQWQDILARRVQEDQDGDSD